MNPKEYNLKELKDMRLTLLEVQDPSLVYTIIATYETKGKHRKKCSYCNKLRIVYVIEGRSPLTNLDRRNQKLMARNIYHLTFYLICESCAVARNI